MENIIKLNQDTFYLRRLNIAVAQHYNLFAEYIKLLQELKDKYVDSKHSKFKIEKLIVHQAKRRLNILVHEVIEREKKHGIY